MKSESALKWKLERGNIVPNLLFNQLVKRKRDYRSRYCGCKVERSVGVNTTQTRDLCVTWLCGAAPFLIDDKGKGFLRIEA